jgi:hypothetical protein
MRITVYPADTAGCGSYRLRWPAQALIAQESGHTIRVLDPEQRDIELKIKDNAVERLVLPKEPPDLVVMQRLTHPWMAAAVPFLRAAGIAVVVDVDDDLSAIHPRNPAYMSMHPRPARLAQQYRGEIRHSWQNLVSACQDATLVTCSTPGLMPVYAPHGRGAVVRNCVPERYLKVEHQDSDVIGWPAALVSHPDDPGVVGGAVARIVGEGAQFCTVGPATGTGAAFGLLRDPAGAEIEDLYAWPDAVAELGIGIAPLADTRFNRSKSALKPLELSAVGVPWVGSPRPEYARLNAQGCGVLADTPRRWYKELKKLHNDEKARTDLSAGGREAVRAMTIEGNAWRWLELWELAVKMQRGQAPG